MIDASPLTSRYRKLQAANQRESSQGDGALALDHELDQIYRQLISLPIFSLADAVDRLAFADHCLVEEFDFKEASNIIRQVAAALMRMQQSTDNPPPIFATTQNIDRDQ